MELDISSLWSWTVPLWGLFVIVFFLGGVYIQPVVFQGMDPQNGGKRVRFSFGKDK
jgi:hypothetical protein